MMHRSLLNPDDNMLKLNSSLRILNEGSYAHDEPS